MKFIFSSSNEPHKDKGYYKGFTPFSSKNIDKVVAELNTKSICPAIFSKDTNSKESHQQRWQYHRHGINTVKIGNIFRLDCDLEGEADLAEAALRREGFFFIKKPSKSNDGKSKNYKYHFIIPAKNVSQDPNKYKKQYEYLCLTTLEIKMSDNGVATPATNISPRLAEDAIPRTLVVKGEPFTAPNIPDAPKRIKHKPIKGKKLKELAKEIKRKLKTLSPDMEYPEWFQVGLALNTEFGYDGIKLFDKWSSKGKKYDAEYLQDKWNEIDNTNQKMFTAGTIFKMNKMGKVIECPEDEFVPVTKTTCYSIVTVESFYND